MIAATYQAILQLFALRLLLAGSEVPDQGPLHVHLPCTLSTDTNSFIADLDSNVTGAVHMWHNCSYVCSDFMPKLHAKVPESVQQTLGSQLFTLIGAVKYSSASHKR